jgi:hypothetical protein
MVFVFSLYAGEKDENRLLGASSARNFCLHQTGSIGPRAHLQVKESKTHAGCTPVISTHGKSLPCAFVKREYV